MSMIFQAAAKPLKQLSKARLPRIHQQILTALIKHTAFK
jgi:hypothetical protein